MANLNLSEFGEKLFVTDADHTFIWDTANSISKRVSRNSWLNSGTLTSDAPVTISQTWNNAAVAFTGFKVNAVSTASAAASLLLDLQVGGLRRLTVQKDGWVNIGASDVGSAVRLLDLTNQYGNVGFQVGGGGRLDIMNGGSTVSSFFSGGAMTLTGSGASIGLGTNLALTRDADNTLALRNGANAQTFNVYGTYTSGTSYERLTLSAPSAANAIIGTNKGSGGGTARGLDLHTDGAARMTITTAGNVGIGTTSPSSKLHVVGDAFLAVNGSNTAPSLRIGAGANINGWYSFGGLQLNAVINSANVFGISASGTNIAIGNLSFGGSADVVLERDAQDELALRRGALGQKFSVYGTYPGAAWERFTITAPTSGNVLLGTYKGTGGIARGLEFQTDGVTRMTIASTGEISTGSNRIGVTPGGLINNGGALGLYFGYSGTQPGFTIASAQIIMTAPIFKFNVLDNTGPALKRSSTTLQTRLADDSAFAPIQGKLTTDTAFTATTVTPTGFITLYDSTGTAYKVPCVPA